MSAPLVIRYDPVPEDAGEDWVWWCEDHSDSPAGNGEAPSQPAALAAALAHCKELRDVRHD